LHFSQGDTHANSPYSFDPLVCRGRLLAFEFLKGQAQHQALTSPPIYFSTVMSLRTDFGLCFFFAPCKTLLTNPAVLIYLHQVVSTYIDAPKLTGVAHESSPNG
jgi:hypothetical protein